MYNQMPLKYGLALFFAINIFGLEATISQKVYGVKYESQADIKIYVVKYESQCDLKVFWVKYASQAKKDGLWFPVKYESQADIKIYFVKYESQADLNIFYVDYPSQAGWKNKDKIGCLSSSIPGGPSKYKH